MKKVFLITIDTEGDNIWDKTKITEKITTKNARYLFRFQELCEKYDFIPTYLTNYEMMHDDAMIALGREGVKRKTLEIGAHLHSWNQPPYFPLIKRFGERGMPYAGEYPKMIVQNKIHYLTKELQDVFQCDIKSHRGGRWFLNYSIVNYLDQMGYTVDCTCTPGIDWRCTRGWSMFSRGTNWSRFNNTPFYLYDSSVMEIPVSIISINNNGYYSWLRPSLNNLREMKKLLDVLYKENIYAEFMLHSSELMPGGSPWFNNSGKIEQLYSNIIGIFDYARALGFEGMSLKEYAEYLNEQKSCV